MKEQIKSFHAISVKYVPWTETTGHRVSINSLRYRTKVIIPSNGENYLDDAILYLTLKGYAITGQAEAPGKGTILFTDNFEPFLK
jgi:hypothetical protein